MIKEKRLTRHQNGDKHLHSCETLGVFITNKVFNIMRWIQKTNSYSAIRFLKRFDSIDHCKLLVKLQAQ